MTVSPMECQSRTISAAIFELRASKSISLGTLVRQWHFKNLSICAVLIAAFNLEICDFP